MKQKLLVLFVIVSFVSCKTSTKKESGYDSDSASGATKVANTVHYPQEKHLKNIRQLTFGGDNAEAYWSTDGKSLVFQSNNAKWGLECDQIFTMSASKPLDSAEIP